jgi:hypothetical protein
MEARLGERGRGEQTELGLAMGPAGLAMPWPAATTGLMGDEQDDMG